MVLHELKQSDYTAMICFCEWLLQTVHDDFTDPQLLLITDEVWFYNRGHDSIQKYEYMEQ
jgi:hypothetical protein